MTTNGDDKSHNGSISTKLLQDEGEETVETWAGFAIGDTIVVSGICRNNQGGMSGQQQP